MGGQEKKQNTSFIFFFTNVWEKVDPLEICAVRKWQAKKKDFITHNTISISSGVNCQVSSPNFLYIFLLFGAAKVSNARALQNIGAAKVPSAPCFTHALQIIGAAAALPTCAHGRYVHYGICIAKKVIILKLLNKIVPTIDIQSMSSRTPYQFCDGNHFFVDIRHFFVHNITKVSIFGGYNYSLKIMITLIRVFFWHHILKILWGKVGDGTTSHVTHL